MASSVDFKLNLFLFFCLCIRLFFSTVMHTAREEGERPLAARAPTPNPYPLKIIQFANVNGADDASETDSPGQKRCLDRRRGKSHVM